MGYSPSRGFIVSITAITGLLSASFVSGFDLSQTSIDVDEVVSGGPGKDGIPALTEPAFVPAAEAHYLDPKDRVVGLEIAGKRKAYPLRILNWHEVVNDTVGGRPVAVTYCPLTASAVVFDRGVTGKTLTFGVSGNLYRSNVLLYDHQNDSMWSQLLGRAVTGPLDGSELQAVAAEVTTWADWQRRHPDSLVLSLATGHRRDYGRDPYADYHASPGTMFSAGRTDRRLAAKEMVIGIRTPRGTKAYAVGALPADGLRDRVGGEQVVVSYDPPSQRATVTDATGKPIPAVVVYWFAWAAFNPTTELWNASSTKESSR